MIRTATALLLMCACAVDANEPSDGIYLRAECEPAPRIVCQDGRQVFLGARQDLKIKRSRLSSVDNANTRFLLSVTVPYEDAVGSSTYVLLVGGTAYRQTGLSASPGKTSTLSFYISGEDKVKEVSKYLDAPPHCRTHPQYALLVFFTPAKQEFSVGEEVTVTLHIKNVGPNVVAFEKGGRDRAARDNQYVFCAYYNGKQVEDIGTTNNDGGWLVSRVLKPGDVFENTINLSKWFSFRDPGLYQIHGAYYLAFNDPKPNSWGTIWEDYASADFTVRIKERKEASNNQVGRE